jgi:hypothetical protein
LGGLTSDDTPEFTWVSGGDGDGTFRFKLNNDDLSSGATETTATSFTPDSALADAAPTLYVQERAGDGFEDEVAGVRLSLNYDPAPGLLTARRLDGGPDPIVERHWWLGWNEFHPETSVYQRDFGNRV